MPMPMTPRILVCPGSTRISATATPTGRARASAMNDVATVPKIPGRAPKSLVTGFHAVATTKWRPNCWMAGLACCRSVSVMSTSAAGTRLAITPITALKPSNGLWVTGRAVALGTAVAIDSGGAHLLPVEAVADAADRHDLERRHVGELLAQPPHVHVHRLAVARELMTPHVLEQRVARVHATGVGEQVGQEVELPLRQLDVAVVHHDPARGAVDRERAEDVPLGHRLRLVCIRRSTAHHRVDAGQHLAHGKGLGDVVVCAELEADDLVDLRVLGGDHDDRHAARLAKGPAEVEAAHAWKHQVEQDQVRPRRACCAKA